jgi:N-acetylmuramoyl-L-alanine amidase
MNHFAYILAALLAIGTLPSAQAADWEELALPISNTREVPEPAPVPARPRPVICVDPGHPNTFNAATDMVNGTNENRINWQVAQRLERILKEKGYDVAMTRNAELHYVENKDRGLFCSASGAVLAVHLHCESTPGSGFALYYPDRVGTYNYKDDPDNGFKGPSAQVISQSKITAALIQNGMKDALAGVLPDRGLYGDSRTAVGSTQGALTFSIFSKIPTVTIEMVVLTNKKDAALIKSEAGQEKMAAAIASGIHLAAQ